MGAGLVLFDVAARAESVRRAAAIAEGLIDADPRTGPPMPMSAMSLVPQHCLTGLAEALNLIGQIKFYYSEFPKTMSSIGMSLLALGLGFGALLGSAVVAIIGAATRSGGHDGWLPSNLNRGRYDYYYLVLAVLGTANVVYFVVCAWSYGEEGQNRVAAADAAAVEEDGKGGEEQHKAVII